MGPSRGHATAGVTDNRTGRKERRVSCVTFTERGGRLQEPLGSQPLGSEWWRSASHREAEEHDVGV